MNQCNAFETKPQEDFHFDVELDSDCVQYQNMLQQKENYKSQLLVSIYNKTESNKDSSWFTTKIL